MIYYLDIPYRGDIENKTADVGFGDVTLNWVFCKNINKYKIEVELYNDIVIYNHVKKTFTGLRNVNLLLTRHLSVNKALV